MTGKLIASEPTPGQMDEGWQRLETAPKDRPIVVYAPPRDGLPEMTAICRWHPDASFCIDELREPTHWIERPTCAGAARPEPVAGYRASCGVDPAGDVQAGGAMTDREMALRNVADIAANAVMTLENAKPYLNHLTPEEAQAWFKARQACDFLYVATNKSEP